MQIGLPSFNLVNPKRFSTVFIGIGCPSKILVLMDILLFTDVLCLGLCWEEVQLKSFVFHDQIPFRWSAKVITIWYTNTIKFVCCLGDPFCQQDVFQQMCIFFSYFVIEIRLFVIIIRIRFTAGRSISPKIG